MARIKYSAIVSSINGSVGHATMQNGSYGAIIRNKPHIPGNKLSHLSNFQTSFSKLNVAWRNLSSTGKNKWDNYNSLRQVKDIRYNSVLLSGKDLFFKYNLFRLNAGLDILTDFDYVVPSITPSISEIAASGHLLNIILDGIPDFDVYFFLFWFRPLKTSDFPITLRNSVLVPFTHLGLDVLQNVGYFYNNYGFDMVVDQPCEVEYMVLSKTSPTWFYFSPQLFYFS